MQSFEDGMCMYTTYSSYTTSMQSIVCLVVRASRFYVISLKLTAGCGGSQTRLLGVAALHTKGLPVLVYTRYRVRELLRLWYAAVYSVTVFD